MRNFSIALLCTALLSIGLAFGAADDVARLHVFSTGTPIRSDHHNAEHDLFVNTLNLKGGRAVDNTWSGVNTFSHGSTPILTNIIGERTAASGVTIDSTLLKDGGITATGTSTFSHATGVTTDTLTERTAAAGVTIDGVLLKDNYLQFPGIASFSPSVNGQFTYDTTDNRYEGRTNGVAAWFLQNVHIAGQSSQETGTSNALVVTPGVQQYHPSAAKSWAKIDVAGGTPSLAGGYNTASVTDGGAGVYVLAWTTNFSTDDYACTATVAGAGGGNILVGANLVSQSVSGITVNIIQNTSLIDLGPVYVTCFGDQ